ncbi:DUF294 nucleotidyltransferase-like domain-containing protein [Paenibacillus xerothermodurans]|uniref:Signal transduction protein n=1 Tax=Paenibacillus xerothermodurans TaxID=1977292 RepID=A0A2W1NT50_PAEXE|nr:DUF294 nucleotidyltransferase-like domain-containing protein [Paenibacillus xerothermodurans]PZE20956.1 hypothetical protein CBW46_009715 [Paenibacillus xerothermodurans]
MDELALDMIRAEIETADDCSQLRRLRDRLHHVFQTRLLVSDALEWNRVLNQVHDCFLRKSVALAQQNLRQRGHEDAPASFAFVLFGSGGRGEQTLWSDQDNGLIYDDPADSADRERADTYFTALSGEISSLLLELGYPPCAGEVICTNRRWRQPLSAFRDAMLAWFADPHWENVRYLLIFADIRTVYGNSGLVRRLQQSFSARISRKPVILEHMLHNTLHHKITLGIFGQLIKERYGADAGGFDIKYGAYIPIVNGIRLLAVEAGIESTSTEQRIIELRQRGRLEEEIAQDWWEALSIAVKLRSLVPYQLEAGQYTSRGKLPADDLTKERTTQLKLCLRIGNDLQKFVKKRIRGEM